ncbi:Putative AP2/EREBP transcription factor superfamily protein [Zea mays]|uniref:rRNA biogenesis protein RRP36 n=1 Tax=Zea mays TaxID=4577 RepID=A0A1D6Q027_MAIZE|nr:Putative AP2/EREBP transcription factor superfamily protein [Zea mays]
MDFQKESTFDMLSTVGLSSKGENDSFKVLALIHQNVIPSMSNPSILCDFLTRSYDIGGVISVMALSGLFILMTQHGLEYRKFYEKLYALLTPAVFMAKHRSVFLQDKQLKSHPPKNVESKILCEHIKKEREVAKARKRPYYLKKSELHERKLMNKYNELKFTSPIRRYVDLLAHYQINMLMSEERFYSIQETKYLCIFYFDVLAL